MDSRILLLSDWTTMKARIASRKVKVSKIEKDDDKQTITGKLAKGSGEAYDPTFNWDKGTVSCGCGKADQPELLFCSHLIALFDTLCSKKRTEKYAEKFYKALIDNKNYISYKTPPDSMPTGCNIVDKLLDGGFVRGVVTYIAGPTKVNKTWMASQTAIYNSILGKNILYIDTEKYYKQEDVYPRMAGYFKSRWSDLWPDPDKKIPMNFLFPTDYKDLASYLGIAMSYRSLGGKIVPTIFSNVPRGEKSPLYGICKNKNIDMIIVDSFTALFKKGVPSATAQSLPGRGDMINKMLSELETLAEELGIAALVVNHASRTYDFNVNDLLSGKNESGSGVWGGYSFMFNVKYLIQIEYIPTTDTDNKIYKDRMARYVIRRFWPAMAPQYVIAEILTDYGYEDFNVKGNVTLEKKAEIRDLSKELEEIKG